MKLAHATRASSFGREVTLRLGRKEADALCTHMRQDSRIEQMAFGLASLARTPRGTILIVNELILPGSADLSKQSASGVCPSKEFQSFVYFRALQRGWIIVEFHTHPGGSRPHFSGTDDSYGNLNAEYIRRKLPEPITLALVVGNNTFDSFDGVIYDRSVQLFKGIDRLEILGRPSEIRRLQGSCDESPDEAESRFDRQVRIPGWNQRGLEQQRIAVVGLGGNGAQVFHTLIGIGAGLRGGIVLIDSDSVETSNLPRIPYASSEHVGTPKVTVAAQYAGHKSPSTPVYAFPCDANEKAAVDRIKASTVIFGCGDNDGLRKEQNELAVRYRIPYFDLGCDIQTGKDGVVAGGQIRVVLPGANACLVCCGGFDASQAAIDQMDDAGHAQRAARGYVVGSREQATPSVANLNGLTAQFAIAAFLALINGKRFSDWDYLHIDQLSGRTITAKTQRNPDCPLCGRDGCLGAGDPAETASRTIPLLKKLETGSVTESTECAKGNEMITSGLTEVGHDGNE